VVSTGAVVPYFSHPDNYVRYYEYVPVSGNITWYDALKAAEQRSYQGLTGYLATITSQNENDFIKSKVGSDAWIGGTDDYLFINEALGRTEYASQSASERRWTWISGPEKGQIFSIGSTTQSGMFSSWNGSEPNTLAASMCCSSIPMAGGMT